MNELWADKVEREMLSVEVTDLVESNQGTLKRIKHGGTPS